MFEPSNLWPWFTLVFLGAFHGLNPAMGWLFAVALGFQERRAKAVLTALGPIAFGHALAITVVAIPVALLQVVLPARALLVTGGLALLFYASYKIFTRFRHPRWVGMRVRPVELISWSALMAAAHGAGLMLIPALARLPSGVPAGAEATGHEGHLRQIETSDDSVITALAAVSVHTVSMLAVMGVIALVVYRWVGVEILRRAWVNLDLVWTATLLAAGSLTLASGLLT